MKLIHAILAAWLLTVITAIGQPAPILRNAWSTNTAGQTVRGNSDLSISNATASLSYTQWWFYAVGPNTVARLTDVSNIVSTASGAASNAVSTIQSNGVTVTTMATNLNFVDSPTVTVLMTNSPSGKIHVSFQATSGGSGETNYNGEVFTNATFIGLVFDKVNNTNRLRSVMGGNGILITNNGTNLVFAINPAVVASQTDLNAASNVLNTLISSKQNGSAVLTNLVGTVANNVTNVVSLSTSNATSKPLTNSYTAGVLTLRGLESGSGISLGANASNITIAATGGSGTVTNEVLTNLINTASFNVTNVVSLSTSNLLSKPITNHYENGVLTLRGIEAASLITITENASNYVLGWSGFGARTNAVQVNGATSILIFTNRSGINVDGLSLVGGISVIGMTPDWLITASQTNLTSASNTLQIATSNNVKVAAGAGSFVDTNSSGVAMVYTVSSITNAFFRLPVQSYLPGTNPPAPGLDQGTNQTWRMLFDDSTNETAYYQFTLPDRYFTNANLNISWSVLASASSKSNVWKLACMVVPAAGGVSVNVDAYNATNSFTNIVMSVGYVTNTVISCGIPTAVANDFIKLKLWREGTDAFDNNSGDTAVHDLRITYDIKKP